MYPNIATPVPARELQVKNKLGALSASLELLEKDISMLDERLRYVSIQDVPQPDKNRDVVNEPCPMVDELQAFIRRTEYLRGKIENITSRLEI